MAFLSDTRFVERLQFFNGQRLFAADLQGLEAFNREMRWLHNQSLHQPGVGNGFAVAGKKDDREVTIIPGYAVDDKGREIVLSQTHTEPIPPVASEDDGTSVFFDLTVSYPEDSELDEAERRAGICLGSGVVRLQEAPIFCWVRLGKDERGILKAKDPTLGAEINIGRKIVLARAEVLNCRLNSKVSVAPRRNARPSKQPYIACDIVAPNWQNFEKQVRYDEAGSLTILEPRLSAIITTENARFINIPCYTARIHGTRIQQGDGNSSFFVDGLVNILEAQPASFRLEVQLMVQVLSGTGQIDLKTIVDPKTHEIFFLDWEIVWMGVEG